MLRSIFLLLPVICPVFAQELLANPRCNHYPERGSCETSFEVKWYYDRFDHRCRRFFYGGCDGNDNRFESLTECEQTCHFDSQIEETSSQRCFQSHDPGHCYGNFERWYFDSKIGRCICSYWTGCGGNSNRFYSYPHCMSICGEFAVDKSSQERQEPDVTVYEAPLRRVSVPPPDPPFVQVPHRPPPVIARPKDTAPLGGGVLYPSHVMTPVHPPIYDDPDLFKIHPVHEDENDEEPYFDSSELPENPDPPMVVDNPQEWSAKTETRFFPHLIKPLPKFPEEEPPKQAYDEIVEEGDDNSKEMMSESIGPLNLRPPNGFDGAVIVEQKSKKREAQVEVAETDFRTHRRRSAKPVEKEEFETDFQRANPKQKKEEYEKYEAPFTQNQNQQPPRMGYVVPAPRLQNPPAKTKTLYNEYAETPFIRHTYLNPPIFPGYPILRSLDANNQRTIPQPVPQGLINQLIQQHLALRERQEEIGGKHVIEVRETPFRRLPGADRTVLVKTPESLSYEEKRRRWKENMKKKLRGSKIPPRQIVPQEQGRKYYVTYSPYYKLYQISRDPPYGFWRNSTAKTTPSPIATTTTTTTTTTTSAPPTTTTTSKSVAMSAEELALIGSRQQVRVAANIPAEQERQIGQIVYPAGSQQLSNPQEKKDRKIQDQTVNQPIRDEDRDFVMPKEEDEKSDYFDYGQSEEDLFFWKPGYDAQKRAKLSKIKPDADAFEITVHRPEDLKRKF